MLSNGALWSLLGGLRRLVLLVDEDGFTAPPSTHDDAPWLRSVGSGSFLLTRGFASLLGCARAVLGRPHDLFGLAGETLLPCRLAPARGLLSVLRCVLSRSGRLDQTADRPEDGHRNDEEDIHPLLAVTLSQPVELYHPILHAAALSTRAGDRETTRSTCENSIRSSSAWRSTRASACRRRCS